MRGRKKNNDDEDLKGRRLLGDSNRRLCILQERRW